MRYILTLLLSLALVALVACPKSNETAPPAQGAAKTGMQPEQQPAEYVPSESEVLAVVNNMVDALNEKDQDKFTACFHPESGELEEMQGFFAEFDPAKQQVEFSNLSVEELTTTAALIEYSLRFTTTDSAEEPEQESGEFELVRTAEGVWVINDLN